MAAKGTGCFHFSWPDFIFFFRHSNKNGEGIAFNAISAHIVFADLIDMALRCKSLAVFSQIPVTGRALWRIRGTGFRTGTFFCADHGCTGRQTAFRSGMALANPASGPSGGLAFR
ncbi:hypothetical protein [Pannonibacter phragmitetus]|uniref:hypothetical protein n=1 Tax=Pannonibacter phragmitetus TaxID=121719 RepID=UPI0011C04B10|nr:hypothetical protein [Pannonibacter phragmitetus]